MAQTIPTYAAKPPYINAEEACRLLSLKDRRTLDKLGIRKIRLTPRAVRYAVSDIEALIERRQIGGAR